MKKRIVFLIILFMLPIVYSEEINIPETFKSENVKVTSYFYTGNGLIATKDLNGIKYYSQDRLGSNRLITDSNSNQIGETKTLPFGEEIVNDNKFSFTGKELDSELYYFGARYYDFDTGRFTSVDPIGTNYQYVDNNPMNYIDVTGLDPSPALNLKITDPPNDRFIEEINYYGISFIYGGANLDYGGVHYDDKVKVANQFYIADIFNSRNLIRGVSENKQDLGTYLLYSFNFGKIFPNLDEETARLEFANFLISNQKAYEYSLVSTSQNINRRTMTCAGLAFYLLSEFAKYKGEKIVISYYTGGIDPATNKIEVNTIVVDPSRFKNVDFQLGLFARVENVRLNSYLVPFSSAEALMPGDMPIRAGHMVVITRPDISDSFLQEYTKNNPEFTTEIFNPVLYDPVPIPENEFNPSDIGRYA